MNVKQVGVIYEQVTTDCFQRCRLLSWHIL